MNMAGFGKKDEKEKKPEEKAKKKLGQHFLGDKNILHKEAKLARVRGKVVLEIGAGDGRLSAEVMKFKPKFLFAVEIDQELADEFCKRFEGKENVVLLKGDFMTIQLPQFEVVVGNIPYYISSDIIFRLSEVYFERAVLIVQKEFAERMVAEPGSRRYGRLSVTSQLAFDVSIAHRVPRRLFTPQPRVDSAMVVLEPGKYPRLTGFQEDVIRALFSHKNKTVRNALVHSKKYSREKINGLPDGVQKVRPRKLTKEQVLEIADMLK